MERFSFQDYARARRIVLRAEDEPELLEDPDFQAEHAWAQKVIRRYEAGLS